MSRRFGWLLIALLHWTVVVQFLRRASPVSIDGSGPMASFHWGAMPLPEMGEYLRRQSYYDLIYSVPYYIAGLVITAISIGITPLVLRRLRITQNHVFWKASGTTLALLLLAAIGSDLGSMLGAWASPMFVLHRRHDFWTMWVLSQVVLPASVLSGVTHSLRRGNPPRQPPPTSSPD